MKNTFYSSSESPERDFEDLLENHSPSQNQVNPGSDDLADVHAPFLCAHCDLCGSFHKHALPIATAASYQVSLSLSVSIEGFDSEDLW